MKTFPVEEFLATPGLRSIRLRYGPGMEDAVEIDQAVFDQRKQELLDFCLGLDNVEGMSWRLLKQCTGGNGLMAKVLIALGQLVGAWTMHPALDIPQAWTSTMYPTIFGRTAPTVSPSRTPKPSAGDLEVGTTPCRCCKRPMGPSTSHVHEVFETFDGAGYCSDCAVEGCGDEEGDCLLEEAVKVRAPRLPTEEGVEEEDPSGAPPGLETYLRNMS